MIVPAPRLILWSAVLLPGTALLAALLPALALPAGGAVLLVVLLALADALAAQRQLTQVTLTLPELTRFVRGRPGKLEVRLAKPARTRLQLRFDLALPDSIGTTQGERTLILDSGHETFASTWELLPSRRGCHHITRALVAILSPLGFWEAADRREIRAELRVYPDLGRDLSSVAAIFLNGGSLGIHALRMVGQGREFEKLREYIAGDSFSDIHWKASAKRGQPVTKQFQIERTQEVVVVIDASRLSGRTAEGASDPVLERYIAAALVLGRVAERQGDLFGLGSFDDQVRAFLRPSSGRAHFNACRESLLQLNPRDVAPDFEELFIFLSLRLRRRSLVVFLTNLDDPLLAEAFAKHAPLLSRRHLILAVMATPPGAKPLFSDPAAVRTDDDVYQALAGHLRWRRLHELQAQLRRQGVQFQTLDSAALTPQLVSTYINFKQRQLL